MQRVSKNVADIGTLLSSGVNVLAMGLAVYLMERAGRRMLLLYGSFGMATSALLVVAVMTIGVRLLKKHATSSSYFNKAMDNTGNGTRRTDYRNLSHRVHFELCCIF